jgi:hypothetical protein
VNGIIATGATFQPEQVSLGAGAATTVQLIAEPRTFALSQRYRFDVAAQSQRVPDVFDRDQATVTFAPVSDVDIAVAPVAEELTGAGQVSYLAVITNTGNLDHTFALTVDTGEPGLSARLEVAEVFIPAHMAASVLVTVESDGSIAEGTYPIRVQAAAVGGAADDTDAADLRVTASPDVLIIYMPLITR